MTCKLAVTENEIFPKPRNKSRVLCQLKQIMQSGKNGHREPDEMERVFAETEREKKKLKRAMERLVSQRVRQKKEGGQDKFGGKS